MPDRTADLLQDVMTGQPELQPQQQGQVPGLDRYLPPQTQPHPNKQDRRHQQHNTSECLSDTAGAVREVTKKIVETRLTRVWTGKTRIKWENPKSVMIITKPGDVSLVGMTRELALWLIRTPRYGQPGGLTVYVDEKLKCARGFRYKKIVDRFPECTEKLRFWNPELCAVQPKLFDFIVTLGGDGTVLFTSWLFQNYIPPVIPFHLGSLGFLTPFDFERYDEYLTHAMQNGVRINLRGRLTCTVYRRVPHPDCKTPEEARSIHLRNVKRNPITGKITVGGWCKDPKKSSSKRKKFGEVDGEDLDEDHETDPDFSQLEEDEITEHRQIPCFTTVPVEKYHVINDLVVDRGPSPYVSLLELFGDDMHLTTVQADGLAISTPTGSTAYSLSAGGSLTHPEIHATLITPICPHTLSFRPTLVPDSMELRVCVPFNSRNTAWASFDGRGRVELKQGDHIKITASKYPFPTVCKEDQAKDWFNSLSNCLHWNRRQRQKSFAIVESNRKSNHQRSAPITPGRSTTPVSRRPSGSALSRSMMMTNMNNSSTSSHGTTASSPTSPVNAQSSVSLRRNNRSPNSTASDVTHDEVFGMFCDDDWRESIDDEDMSSPDDFDLDDSDDEDEDAASVDGGEDGFRGWADEEILKARYQASIAHELERLSLSEKKI
ncbi:ATP-NAD kinase-like domain-containing protein [Syncephalastrum racemosum]|uniref:ATP-NAD kinase-like domain-containing protein n=1 Tax=Syncephalastrum racemosum TaxID=13706 RepID=A0A1X2HQL6_SYNRA|nr:ATP-NAD kinase-like domain-containing protein [Syncephalastrum racemosum]